MEGLVFPFEGKLPDMTWVEIVAAYSYGLTAHDYCVACQDRGMQSALAVRSLCIYVSIEGA